MPAPGQKLSEIRETWKGAFPNLRAGLTKMVNLLNELVRAANAQPGGNAPAAIGQSVILATHRNGLRTEVTVLTTVTPAGQNNPVNPADL